MQIAEGVFRLGSRYVNFYAVENGGRVTLVDAGIPGYWEQIPTFLGSIGRTPSDVEAIVQTHSHNDHTGCTERLRAETGAAVLVHRAEAAILTGDEKAPSVKGMGGVLTSPRAYPMIGHILSNGGSRSPKVAEVQSFEEGEVLDVPGKLRPVLTPGHSPGHCSFLLEDQGVLFTGDALVTRNLGGRIGPRLMDINVDVEEAGHSLDAISNVAADLVLPGHGEPWHGGTAEAARLARAT